LASSLLYKKWGTTFAKGAKMKFMFLALLSFSTYANFDGEASCVVGNHQSQHFRENGYSGDIACENAKRICERQTGMVCFEIDREEGSRGYDDDYGYDDNGYEDGDFERGHGDFDRGGYDDWDVINGRRVNQVVCKVQMFSRGGRSVIRKQGRTPSEACQKALRACRSQVGPRGSCGRAEVERNYRR
jgi:hypothetical protein